jgi:hypothetical protein
MWLEDADLKLEAPGALAFVGLLESAPVVGLLLSSARLSSFSANASGSSGKSRVCALVDANCLTEDCAPLDNSIRDLGAFTAPRSSRSCGRGMMGDIKVRHVTREKKRACVKCM